jgi:thioredoxin reductase (NADPH)
MPPVTYDADTVPVVVLGGGVAGLTAAIYLSQANVPVLVIEGPKPGGALSQSQGVRNWPGEYNVPGAQIMQKIKNHALACGVQILQAQVTAVNVRQVPFTFDLEPLANGQKTTVKAAACIIAMGTEPNFLNVPGERGAGGYWGRGVSNCAVCDGFFFKNKQVAVVGGGDAAVEEASYLANLAAAVTILVRKNTFRAKDVKARERLVTRPNVKVLFNTSIKEIKGDGKGVTGVLIENSTTGEQQTLPVNGVFLAIGSRPNTDLFKGQLELDARGFVVLKHHQAASVAGVFAAGDVADPHFVQAITAAGDGCRAALQVKKYLEEIGFKGSATAEAIPSQSAGTLHGIIEIESEQQFKTVIAEAKQPVFLDMYATWCLPCKLMMPTVEKLAKEFEGKVVFAKLNVAKKEMDLEKLMPMIQAKSVYSVPTFILVKNGKEIRHIDGSRNHEVLQKMITTLLENPRDLAFVQ